MANQDLKKHTKEYSLSEIYKSYYWFVTHINPHLFYHEKNSFPYNPLFPSDTRPLLTFNKLDCHDSVPECVHEAIEQLIREWRGCGNISKELVFDETGKAVWLVGEHDLYEYVLRWLVDNGIRDNDLFLYTPSGSPIYSIKHIKALWSELEIKPRTLLDGKPACMPYLIDNIDIIKNHLTPQYTDNLSLEKQVSLWAIVKEERTVKYKEKSSNLSSILFAIFETLYDNEGKPVAFNILQKELKRKLERGVYGREAIRDYIVDIKNEFRKDFKIDRDLMEKIIEKKPSTGKIKTVTFHKNP